MLIWSVRSGRGRRMVKIVRASRLNVIRKVISSIDFWTIIAVATNAKKVASISCGGYYFVGIQDGEIF